MKALVLCAGYGARLGDLTREIPKPMLPLAGEPLLAYTLRYLAHFGFRDIAINLHFRPEVITEFLGDGSRFGVRLHYSYEPVRLGTAGAIRNLQAYFSDVDDLLVMYGDLLVDVDLHDMAEFHRTREASATLLLHQRPNSNSLIRMDGDNRIVEFLERPGVRLDDATRYPWVNSGLQILSQRMLAHIPADGEVDLPRDVYIPMLHRARLYGFPLRGYRCAIDSPAGYAEAQRAVFEGRYPVRKYALGQVLP